MLTLQIIVSLLCLVPYVIIIKKMHKLTMRHRAELSIQSYFKDLDQRKMLSHLQDLDDKYEDQEQYIKLYKLD